MLIKFWNAFKNDIKGNPDTLTNFAGDCDTSTSYAW